MSSTCSPEPTSPPHSKTEAHRLDQDPARETAQGLQASIARLEKDKARLNVHRHAR
jgi:hypothetical protein